MEVFAATYGMNTWQAWAQLDPAGIVLHSVPPMLVFCAAETAPWLRDRLTEAVLTAAGQAHTGHGTEPVAASENERAPVGSEPGPSAPTAGPAPPTGRKLLADYLAEARAAWSPGVHPSPAWVRQVTACGRGTSQKVADTLRTELNPSRGSHPAGEPTGEVPA